MTRAKTRIAVVCWFIAVVACAVWSLRYGSTPGAAAASPPRMPNLSLQWKPGAVRIVQAIHPNCPCSRASLEMLREILRTQQADVDAVLLIADYGDSSWNDSATVAEAERLDGARIQPDPGARLALSLGMRTSGHTLAYAPSGDLLFSGGVTASRGMIGPAPGQELLQIAIKTAKPASHTSPVFGCPLSDDDDAACAPGCGDQP